MPRGSQGPDRAGADRVHPDALPAQIGGQVAHRGLQRRLRHAHHVVVRGPAFGADIGEGQQAAAGRHHRHGTLRDGGERVAGDVQRLQERCARRVQVASAQIGLVGIADGVHQEVEASPLPLQCREGGVDARLVGHVAGNTRSEFTDAASGRTRRSRASPWKVNASSAPCAAQAAAMPQASERSLATPMISPRLPCSSVPLAGVIAVALSAMVDPSGSGVTRRRLIASVVTHAHVRGQEASGRRTAGRSRLGAPPS